MNALSPALVTAFDTAAAELGHVGAAELFIAEIAALRGEDGIHAFRDLVGREFPVADALASRWIDGWRPRPIDATDIAHVLRGLHRVVVVGLEALRIDALLDACPRLRLGLLPWSALRVDWDRVIANWGGRVAALDLDAVHGWTGADAGVLCFAYGGDADRLFVPAAWLRLNGPDTRPQFRSLVAWNVLPSPFTVYPRWFHEVPAEEFTAVVRS